MARSFEEHIKLYGEKVEVPRDFMCDGWPIPGHLKHLRDRVVELGWVGVLNVKHEVGIMHPEHAPRVPISRGELLGQLGVDSGELDSIYVMPIWRSKCNGK